MYLCRKVSKIHTNSLEWYSSYVEVSGLFFGQNFIMYDANQKICIV